jgi:hypothetical protein
METLEDARCVRVEPAFELGDGDQAQVRKASLWFNMSIFGEVAALAVPGEPLVREKGASPSTGMCRRPPLAAKPSQRRTLGARAALCSTARRCLVRTIHKPSLGLFTFVSIASRAGRRAPHQPFVGLRLLRREFF